MAYFCSGKGPDPAKSVHNDENRATIFSSTAAIAVLVGIDRNESVPWAQVAFENVACAAPAAVTSVTDLVNPRPYRSVVTRGASIRGRNYDQ